MANQPDIYYVGKEEIINGWKVVHSYPIITEEEDQRRHEEILLKLYRLFQHE